MLIEKSKSKVSVDLYLVCQLFKEENELVKNTPLENNLHGHGLTVSYIYIIF